MSDPKPIIILKRAPGPADGLSIITVDAPGFTQAEFVVSEAIRDTPQEQTVLRQMMESRLDLRDALKEVDF